MKHSLLLLCKFIASFIAFTIGFFYFPEATFVDVTTFALLVTVVSYIAGDLFLLPRFGNTIALVGDFLFTYLAVWIFGSVLFHNYMLIAWGSILSAFVITIGEVFVHRYMLKHSRSVKSNESTQTRFAFNTEFGEDEDYSKIQKKED
ncbi:YndM family protein [Shouchella clausii]|uniref:DUF2512 domain-containing protein n=1 Tax=Shouchella clausii TaxID=79880 RepID=A0A268NUT6_SHOCL|nr:YndM family protein [Shouchella clausii]MEB5480329.1 YndM family protein [Shouchella clausii]PAD16027.1 hypothetical protein CHH74_04905 [Shouchella clausii]PAE87277.1 hypothetical protein CHH72_19035 [Shouchella clausii]